MATASQDLSDREVEVLARVAGGYTNEEIAESLFIEHETVKSHMRHILAKLGAPNRTHAVGLSLTHHPEIVQRIGVVVANQAVADVPARLVARPELGEALGDREGSQRASGADPRTGTLMTGGRPPTSAFEELTPRQLEILALVASGLRNPEIGERLGVSLETVKSHSHRALERLNARTRSQAVALWLIADPDGAFALITQINAPAIEVQAPAEELPALDEVLARLAIVPERREASAAPPPPPIRAKFDATCACGEICSGDAAFCHVCGRRLFPTEFELDTIVEAEFEIESIVIQPADTRAADETDEAAPRLRERHVSGGVPLAAHVEAWRADKPVAAGRARRRYRG